MRVPSLEVTVFIVISSTWSRFSCCADTPCTSAGSWPVCQVDDARGKVPGIDELQWRLLFDILEEAFAAPHDHGVDHEFELVDKAVLEQRTDEGAAAGDHDVLAGLCLQRGDLLRDVLPDQRRVVPRQRPFEGSRDHVLPD